MLRLVHYNLADPSILPIFPCAWGSPPSISDQLRRQVSFGSASILWSEIREQYYETCTVGPSLPGWIVRPEDQLEFTWPIGDDPRPLSASPQPVPSLIYDWKVLFDTDMDRVAAMLSHSTQRRLGAADSSKHDVLIQDPASIGTLRFIHQRATFGPQHT